MATETPMATRTALVTGASAGIGAAFARALARDGHDLVITARRADRLHALADDLRTAHGARVHVVPADLSAPDAPDTIMAAVDRAGLSIDVLINNAGYGIPERFTERPWADQAAFLQVMVTAVAHLSHAVLPGMMARDYGRIVNVSSVAGLLPGSAGSTLYSGAKAFLNRFSESLSVELQGRNIHIQALCPGFTYSEFHDVTGGREEVSALPGFMWMTAEDVVDRSLKALERGGGPVHVPGLFNRTLTGVAKLLPQGVLMGLSRSRARASDAP